MSDQKFKHPPIPPNCERFEQYELGQLFLSCTCGPIHPDRIAEVGNQRMVDDCRNAAIAGWWREWKRRCNDDNGDNYSQCQMIMDGWEAWGR